MCVFGRSWKAEMLSRTRWYKNCYNFSSLEFFNSKLGRMLCNSSSNRFCDFYIFPIVGIGAINFQSKNRQSTLVSRCFFSPKELEKLFDFDFHKLHNMTNVFVQNLGFYRARFSLQSLYKTTPCPLKRQCENHTGVPASDSSHEYTVDRRSIRSGPVNHWVHCKSISHRQHQISLCPRLVSAPFFLHINSWCRTTLH